MRILRILLLLLLLAPLAIANEPPNRVEIPLALIVDGTPPVITIPPFIAVLALTPAGAVVDAAALGFTVTDNLDPAPVVTFDRPVPFTMAANTSTYVTIIATDAAGNFASVQVGVSVQRAYVVTRVAAQTGRLGGALVGTVLDDAPGFQLTSLGTPSLTNLNHIVVTGAAKDAAGAKLGGILVGRTGYNYDPAVLAVDTRWTMPLRTGTPAEEVGPGLLWKAFPREPFMDYRDDTFPQASMGFFTQSKAVPVVFGFHGRVSGSGVTTSNDDVLAYFRGQPAGDGRPQVRDVVAVAREGGPAEGVPGGTFKGFLSAAMAAKVVEAGDLDFGGDTFQVGRGVPGPLPGIAFTAMLNHGPGVDSGNDMGLWIWEESTLRLVLREGQLMPIAGTIPAGPAVRSFVALRGPGGALSVDTNPHHFTVHTTAEQLSATVLITFEDGTRQLAAVSAHGLKPLTTLHQDTLWAGHTNFAHFSTLRTWFRDPRGQVGVLGYREDALGYDVIALEVLAFYDVPELLNFVRDVGVPGYDFLSVPSPAVNSAKTLAFGTRNHRWYVRNHDDGVVRPLFTPGLSAPGTAETWGKVRSLAVPEGMGPLFTATLGDRSAGLWAVDSLGQTHLLLSQGGVVAEKTVRTFRALTVVPGSLAQTRSFNGRRDVLAQVTATDGTQHLVHFAVP